MGKDDSSSWWILLVVLFLVACVVIWARERWSDRESHATVPVGCYSSPLGKAGNNA